MKFRFIFSVFLLIFLFSCSKDDDPEPAGGENTAYQGVFIDSPVAGLRYETETHNGVTDENGKFDYEEGEIVTFYVGEIKLGSAPATEKISPIDLALTPSADLNTLEVQNIAAFLQTLDEDGNPENGIKISSVVVEAIELTEIDFTAPIVQTLGEISISVFKETGLNLNVVFPETAAIHLAQSLGMEYEAQNLYNINFVTIFSNYFGPNKNTTKWVHEFNDNGKLSKSILYEKFPFRILDEFVFSSHLDGKVNFEHTDYSYAKATAPEKREYTAFYNEDFIIEMFENLYTGYNPTPFSVLKGLNAENFIQVLENRDSGNILVSSQNFEYNSDNLISKVFNYDSTGTLSAEKVVTYYEFGDLKTENTVRPDGTYFLYNYYYRDDNTLESKEWEVKLSNSETLVLQEFDENETLLKDTTSQIFTNGSSQKTIEYFDEGILISLEWFNDGLLKQKYFYELDDDGGSYLSIQENYDENGNLTSKTCYDVESNIIECNN